MRKDIRRHSWNTTFFLHTDQLFFRLSLLLYTFYCITLQVLRKSDVIINLSNKPIFFIIKNRISRTETRSTLPGQSVSQNLVSGGDKENGSDQMVQKMHSCALVPPPLLVQSRHCEAFEARCTSHPQSSPNSLSKARIKGFIYERKLNDKDIIFHSFKSELLFFVPRKGLRISSSNWAR